MATTTTYTPILRLSLSPLLTAEAKANLLKIDALGLGVFTDQNGDTVVRSAEDISLLPQDAASGGDGTGGSINLGSPSQILNNVTSYAQATRIEGTLDLKDQSTGGGSHLRLSYVSANDGPVESVDASLQIDVGSPITARSLILNSDLKTNPASISIGPLDFTFPSINSVLASADNVLTFTNKTIDAAVNTLSNIGNSALASNAAIPYSKLNLTASILAGDLANSFALPYSKLNLTNSIINSDVSSSAAIAYSKLNLTSSVLVTDLSNSFALPYARLSLANSIVDSDVSGSATISGAKVNPAFGAQLVSSSSGYLFGNGSFGTTITAAPAQSTNFTLILPPSPPSGVGFTLSSTSTPGQLAWLAAGAGTVTSVGLSLDAPADAIFDVTNSPITTTGSLVLNLATQNANTILSGPSTGIAAAPAFRALVDADIPPVPASRISDFSSAWNTQLASKTTTDLAEGTNLYHTSGRFDSSFSTKSTSDLSEGTNLYYTNSRADARITLQKGVNGGIATLDGGGKIPASQLPSTVMEYLGTWNANTNTPFLMNGIGSAGDVYLTGTAGTTDFGSGNITFAVGDWAVYSGSVWQKSVNSNSVVSVNGYTGTVVLSTTDVAEGTNLYYTSARFNTALAGKSTSDLAESTNLYYTDGRVDTRIATYKVTSLWTSGLTKTVTHNLGTRDITFNVYDVSSGEEIWVNSGIRTDNNTLTLTASVAAPGTGWKIIVRN